MTKRLLILSVYFLIASSLAALPQHRPGLPEGGRHGSADGRGTDGHFHDPIIGKPQPDMCNNDMKSEHPCECNRTKTDQCDVPRAQWQPGRKCLTNCRQDACRCIAECTS